MNWTQPFEIQTTPSGDTPSKPRFAQRINSSTVTISLWCHRTSAQAHHFCSRTAQRASLHVCHYEIQPFNVLQSISHAYQPFASWKSMWSTYFFPVIGKTKWTRYFPGVLKMAKGTPPYKGRGEKGGEINIYLIKRVMVKKQKCTIMGRLQFSPFCPKYFSYYSQTELFN